MEKNVKSNMEQYAIYLRKSRKDEEAEQLGAGETLARHEKIMLELAQKMNIIVGKIYREIVSGDSISGRPIMQQLLKDVESGMWTGVLVVEVERLARGNTIDQGIVSETFRYSDTKIITPTKTYDPNNEFDEEYFEFGLFMSRREYKTIRRRLHNGIIASVKEGKFVGTVPPFGYDRIKLKGKGWSLKPNPETSKTVQMIFNLYNSGNGFDKLIKILDELNIKSPQGKSWYRSTLVKIISNRVYIGEIQYIDKAHIKKRDENGKKISVKNSNPDIYISKGLHEPIIDKETFEKAQKIRSSNQLKAAKTKSSYSLKNPLSVVLKCKICGKPMIRNAKRNDTYIGLRCENFCVAGTKLEFVEKKIFESLQTLLKDYKLDVKSTSRATNIECMINNTDNQIQALKKELDETSSQKEKLYDFLERGIYTEDIFFERSKSLAKRILDIKNKIIELNTLKENYTTLLERQTNYIPQIEKVIDTYPHANVEGKNKLLKSCLEKVEYYKSKDSKKGDDSFEITLYPKI